MTNGCKDQQQLSCNFAVCLSEPVCVVLISELSLRVLVTFFPYFLFFWVTKTIKKHGEKCKWCSCPKKSCVAAKMSLVLNAYLEKTDFILPQTHCPSDIKNVNHIKITKWCICHICTKELSMQIIVSRKQADFMLRIQWYFAVDCVCCYSSSDRLPVFILIF